MKIAHIIFDGITWFDLISIVFMSKGTGGGAKMKSEMNVLFARIKIFDDKRLNSEKEMHKILYRQLIPADFDEYKRVWLDCLKQYPDNFGATLEEGLNSKSLKLANVIQAANKYNFAFGAFTENH